MLAVLRQWDWPARKSKALREQLEKTEEYFANNAYQPYCQVVVAPKVAKFRKHYFERLKA